MKKIFTLLFCAIVISSSFAQTDGSNNSKIININYYQNIINQRNYEIQQVNYLNDHQVQTVVNNCNLDIWEKRDMLDNLETQRIQNINNVYGWYSNTVAYYHSNERNNLVKGQYPQNNDRR
jgi:hypothetical protein